MFTDEERNKIKEFILKFAFEPIDIPTLVQRVHVELIRKSMDKRGERFNICDPPTRIRRCLVELIKNDEIMMLPNNKIKKAP